MAQKRMFSLHVVDTDLFLDMPATAQALYFHLAMRADDDGFVDSPRKIMKVCNSSDDDYKLLMAKRFVIPFDSGICVIRHWRIHNYIKGDRYHATMYKAEKAQLYDIHGVYEEGVDTEWNHDGTISEPQIRVGKSSIDKNRSDKQIDDGLLERMNAIHSRLFNVPVPTKDQVNARELARLFSDESITHELRKAAGIETRRVSAIHYVSSYMLKPDYKEPFPVMRETPSPLEQARREMH